MRARSGAAEFLDDADPSLMLIHAQHYNVVRDGFRAQAVEFDNVSFENLNTNQGGSDEFD